MRRVRQRSDNHRRTAPEDHQRKQPRTYISRHVKSKQKRLHTTNIQRHQKQHIHILPRPQSHRVVTSPQQSTIKLRSRVQATRSTQVHMSQLPINQPRFRQVKDRNTSRSQPCPDKAILQRPSNTKQQHVTQEQAIKRLLYQHVGSNYQAHRGTHTCTQTSATQEAAAKRTSE